MYTYEMFYISISCGFRNMARLHANVNQYFFKYINRHNSAKMHVIVIPLVSDPNDNPGDMCDVLIAYLW